MRCIVLAIREYSQAAVFEVPELCGGLALLGARCRPPRRPPDTARPVKAEADMQWHHRQPTFNRLPSAMKSARCIRIHRLSGCSGLCWRAGCHAHYPVESGQGTRLAITMSCSSSPGGVVAWGSCSPPAMSHQGIRECASAAAAQGVGRLGFMQPPGHEPSGDTGMCFS